MAVAAVLTAAAAAAEAPIKPADLETQVTAPERPQRPKVPEHAPPALPAEEANVPASTSSGSFGSVSPFAAPKSAVVSADTAISPPVTITYSGGSPALTVTQHGVGRGVQASITNSNSGGSALWGETYGSAAGLAGFNRGTKGPAGKFQVTNSGSAQAAVFANTSGTGPAVLGTVTNPNSSYPAIYGQSTTGTSTGVGVQGEANFIGVYGTSPSGYAIYGHSPSGGVGVYASSPTGYGVYASSNSGTALYAHSSSGAGVYSSSDSGFGIFGESKNSIGVSGVDSGSGFGVYGSSATGYAGYFAGKVGATSYETVSDKNAKTNFQPIDSKDLLDRVGRLPITSWDFKTDLKKRHVGPMAQDFHAAFGLDGDDDKHINLTDLAGVSLAAIQELNYQMKQKDVQIADLKAQLTAQTKTVTEMKSMAEAFSARMAVLEHQRGITAQTASLRTQSGYPSGARTGATE
jgi:hypothetical protein